MFNDVRLWTNNLEQRIHHKYMCSDLHTLLIHQAKVALVGVWSSGAKLSTTTINRQKRTGD